MPDEANTSDRHFHDWEIEEYVSDLAAEQAGERDDDTIGRLVEGLYPNRPVPRITVFSRDDDVEDTSDPPESTT